MNKKPINFIIGIIMIVLFVLMVSYFESNRIVSNDIDRMAIFPNGKKIITSITSTDTSIRVEGYIYDHMNDNERYSFVTVCNKE